MSVLEFIASIVGSLAWPLSIVIVAVLFRHGIRERLQNLLKLKTPGGLEAEFRQEIDDIARRAQRIPVENGHVPSVEPPEIAVELPDTMEYPNMAILEAWRDIEGRIGRASKAIGLDGDATLDVQLAALNDRGVLQRDEVDLIVDMRRVRNAVAHDEASVGSDSARTYVDALAQVARSLGSRE